jgi:hypothetical protein
MPPKEQLKVMREFMLAITPVMTRYCLENSDVANPVESAKLTMEWAMHLSSQFASCYDIVHATPENAPQTNPLKTQLQTSDEPA